VATTVELLTTGVDVPSVRNIVFFKYVRSPIAFYQMIGRGTRLDPATGKLMFRVYDYTDATRLFGEEFKSKFRPPAKEGSEPPTPPSEETAIVAEGFTVKTGPAGKYIVTMVDGKAVPVTAEEYKQRLTARLIAEAATVEQFREHWITPPDRKTMLERLPDGARSAYLVRALDGMDDYDLFDVLAALAYGQAPRTRSERAAAFNYKNVTWLAALPQETAKAIEALAAQFARAGTDGLESRHIFQTAEVQQAGGLQALSKGGAPAEVLRQTKERMFAA
ncbi:MAG: hypothetical protein M1401_07695, partial [Chloroflexi bacterium]|nr:hypothetical protein [Chloroflexota bacterium]